MDGPFLVGCPSAGQTAQEPSAASSWDFIHTHVRWRFREAQSVILLVSGCSLSTYYVQGTVQGAGNGAMSKHKSVALWSPGLAGHMSPGSPSTEGPSGGSVPICHQIP